MDFQVSAYCILVCESNRSKLCRKLKSQKQSIQKGSSGCVLQQDKPFELEDDYKDWNASWRDRAHHWHYFTLMGTVTPDTWRAFMSTCPVSALDRHHPSEVRTQSDQFQIGKQSSNKGHTHCFSVSEHTGWHITALGSLWESPESPKQ